MTLAVQNDANLKQIKRLVKQHLRYISILRLSYHKSRHSLPKGYGLRVIIIIMAEIADSPLLGNVRHASLAHGYLGVILFHELISLNLSPETSALSGYHIT